MATTPAATQEQLTEIQEILINALPLSLSTSLSSKCASRANHLALERLEPSQGRSHATTARLYV